MYSTGDILNNILVTLYSDRWSYPGDCIAGTSMLTVPETKIMYANYTLIV